MKLQNKQTKSKVAIINIVLLIIFITSFVFYYFDIQVVRRNDEIACVISVLLLLYMSYLGCPFFRYDSEGETLIFQNQKSFPLAFLVNESQSDFPKRKLAKFNIKGGFLFKKRLEVYIYSKRVSSGMTKVTFDISYLTSKQIRDLNISLNKVLKENAQYEQGKTVDFTEEYTGLVNHE